MRALSCNNLDSADSEQISGRPAAAEKKKKTAIPRISRLTLTLSFG